MTVAPWRKVVAMNVTVNEAVKPMNDSEIYGKTEVWTYPTESVGDCEDYVLESSATWRSARGYLEPLDHRRAQA